MTDYGRRLVIDMEFERALTETTHAIGHEGMQIVARTDVRDRFWRDLGHDFRRYYLLEAWSPELAFEALRHSLDIGAILPTTFASSSSPTAKRPLSRASRCCRCRSTSNGGVKRPRWRRWPIARRNGLRACSRRSSMRLRRVQRPWREAGERAGPHHVVFGTPPCRPVPGPMPHR